MQAIVFAAFAAAIQLSPPNFHLESDHASDIIVLRVGAVGRPSAEGRCWVGGEVMRIDRGPHYRRGEQITLAVPCGKASLQPVGDAPFRLDADWLTKVTRATVGVDSNGDVVRFEALNGLSLIS